MSDTATKIPEEPSVNVEETLKNNANVDPAQLAAVLEAMRDLKTQGIALSQFSLVLPFTRLRSPNLDRRVR